MKFDSLFICMPFRVRLCSYAINQWCIDLPHSLFVKFALPQNGKMQTFRKYLSRHFSPLGDLEVIRVDSVKIANEIRMHAGTSHLFIAYPIRVT